MAADSYTSSLVVTSSSVSIAADRLLAWREKARTTPMLPDVASASRDRRTPETTSGRILRECARRCVEAATGDGRNGPGSLAVDGLLSPLLHVDLAPHCGNLSLWLEQRGASRFTGAPYATALAALTHAKSRPFPVDETILDECSDLFFDVLVPFNMAAATLRKSVEHTLRTGPCPGRVRGWVHSSVHNREHELLRTVLTPAWFNRERLDEMEADVFKAAERWHHVPDDEPLDIGPALADRPAFGMVVSRFAGNILRTFDTKALLPDITEAETNSIAEIRAQIAALVPQAGRTTGLRGPRGDAPTHRRTGLLHVSESHPDSQERLAAKARLWSEHSPDQVVEDAAELAVPDVEADLADRAHQRLQPGRHPHHAGLDADPTQPGSSASQSMASATQGAVDLARKMLGAAPTYPENLVADQVLAAAETGFDAGIESWSRFAARTAREACAARASWADLDNELIVLITVDAITNAVLVSYNEHEDD